MNEHAWNMLGCAHVCVSVRRLFLCIGVCLDVHDHVCASGYMPGSVPCVRTCMWGMLVSEHKWAWVTLVSPPQVQGAYFTSVGRGLPQPAWPGHCGRRLGVAEQSGNP